MIGAVVAACVCRDAAQKLCGYLRRLFPGDDGCGYRASKKVKYTATITYHDTGEVVNLPFFQAVRDLDG